MSLCYRLVEALLDGGWVGTYGDLAQEIGLAANGGRCAGGLVRAYSRRRPNWNHFHVVKKSTSRPAYMG